MGVYPFMAQLNPTTLIRHIRNRLSYSQILRDTIKPGGPDVSKQQPDSADHLIESSIFPILHPQQLAFTQTPCFRVHVKSLIVESNFIANSSDAVAADTTNLQRQCECQVRLIISRDQPDGALHNQDLLFCDSQNGIFKFSKTESLGELDLKEPFDVQTSKLLVIDDDQGSRKIRIANSYRLHITVRLLDQGDVSTHLFADEEKPTESTLGAYREFRTSLSTPLTSRKFVQPLTYNCNGEDVPTRLKIALSSTLSMTTRSQLQLYKALLTSHSTRENEDVDFVWGATNSMVWTARGFRCPLCDGRKFGCSNSLEIHLRKVHDTLQFTKREVIENGKGRTQFVVGPLGGNTEHLNKLGSQSRASLPGGGPPTANGSGVQRWVQDGKWLRSRDASDSPVAKRRRLNNSISAPGATRLTLPTSPHTVTSTLQIDGQIIPREAQEAVTDGLPFKKLAHTIESTLNGTSPRRERPFNHFEMSQDEHHSPRRNVKGAHTGSPSVTPRSTKQIIVATPKNGPPTSGTVNGSVANKVSSESASGLRSMQIRATSKSKMKGEETREIEAVLSRNLIDATNGKFSRTPSRSSRANDISVDGDVTHHPSKADDHLHIKNGNPSLGRTPHASPNNRNAGKVIPPVDSRKLPTRTDRYQESPPHKMLKADPSTPDITRASKKLQKELTNDEMISPKQGADTGLHGAVRAVSKVEKVNGIRPQIANDKKTSLARSVTSIYTSLEVDKLIREVGQLPKCQRSKHLVPPTPKGVTLFRTATKRQLTEGEVIDESEDEIEDSWAMRRHEQTIDANDNSTATAKAFIKRWDEYFHKEQLCANKHAADAVLRFTLANRRWLRAKEMQTEFSFKLDAWLVDDVITWVDIDRCFAVLNSNERGARGGGSDQAIPTNRGRKAATRWTSGCSCGKPIGATEMDKAVTCANISCLNQDYHMACVGLSQRPSSWHCPQCEIPDA